MFLRVTSLKNISLNCLFLDFKGYELEAVGKITTSEATYPKLNGADFPLDDILIKHYLLKKMYQE
jgi:hypothetical protein